MRSVNKAIIIGQLGRDAECKFTSGGTAKVTFSVATSRKWKDQASGDFKEETDWHNVVAWKMENLANHLTKGQAVYIEGRISNRKYEKDGETRYISEIVADTVNLLGGKSEERTESPAPRRGAAKPDNRPLSQSLEIDETDVPF